MRTKQKKPADGAASEPPSVLMRVLSVSTKLDYISSKDSVLVVTFLHESGFTGITVAGGQTTAVAPKPEKEADPVIFVECRLGAGGKLATMEMVRTDRETSRLIDRGHVIFEYNNDNKGKHGFWAGGENISDWDIVAVVDDSLKVTEPKASVSAADTVVKIERVKRPPKVYVAAWRRKPWIPDFIRDRCGGDGSMAAVSKALNAIPVQQDVDRVRVLCKMFEENQINISNLLMPAGLHVDLQPLLDKPSDDPERIDTSVLRELVTLPKDKQVEAWNKAKVKPKPSGRRKVIKELRAKLS